MKSGVQYSPATPGSKKQQEMSSVSKKQDKINVRVAVRVRPMSDAERADNATSIVKVEERKMTVTCKSKVFSAFDKVYGTSADQERIYKEMVSPQVERVLAGYNCTLFAYGQTGTGKTYTMEGGSTSDVSYKDDPTIGIIPRAVEHIFEELEKSNTEEYSIRVSYLELYNEELYDLLAPTSEDRERLRIFDDPSKKGMVVVSGAEELPVRNRFEVYNLLKRGADRRVTAATFMNMNSSRSHSIFTVSVVLRENTQNGEELVKQGKLNLVDLAGSEHIGRSGAEGKRAKEAGNINQSLLTLGRVITALTTSAPHVPYRESKLTRLLQDSLGGSTITSIIATLSPASTNYEESVSTLEYAARAKSIRNHPECNQTLTRKALLKEYNEEIEKLRRDLRSAREKNGIFLSQESYTGMENEIATKTEQLRELEGQLDAAIKKLQKFIEDQEIMDEQYRELYHRNKRLETKLQQRIDELDDTRKELHTVNTAFQDAHSLATQLHAHLKETREVVYDQQLDLEDWWAKEESLSQILTQNKQCVMSARSKVLSEITGCCAELSEFVSTCADRREVLNKTIEQGLEELRECVNNCNKSVKSADEVLLRWSDESEGISKTFVSRIFGFCSNSETLEENLAAQVKNICSMGEELSQMHSVVKKEMTKISQTMEELTKQTELMLRKRRETIEKDASERANAMNTLRHHREQRILKMIELANAIVAECQSYHDESENTLTMMKSHDVAMFENSLMHLQKLQTVIQQHEVVTMKSNSVIDNVLEDASQIAVGRASSTEVLTEACSTLNEISKNIKKETVSFADDVTNKNRYFTDCMRNSLSRIEFSGEHIGNISGNNEEKRVESQNEQLKRERAIVQHVRDSLGEVNKEISALVEENWLSREDTGKTPKKSHYPVANDSEIPHVPKKEKMLLSKSSSISSETSKKLRTRESLLEVQNVCLSPDTLAATRRSRLESIGEESALFSHSGRVYSKASSKDENRNCSISDN